MSATAARARLAVRLARREVRRHLGRHVIVVLLIFVPTLAAFATFSAISSAVHIDQQRRDRAWAGASLIASEPSPRDPEAPVEVTAEDLARLPEGTHVEHRWTSADWLVLPRARADGLGPELVGASVAEVPPTSRLVGRYVVDRGRLPQRDGEVFLTVPLASAGGWNIADGVTSARTGRELEVVGVGRAGNQTDERSMVVAPDRAGAWGALLDGLSGSVDVGGDQWTNTDLDRWVLAWLPEGAPTPAAGWDQHWFLVGPALDARTTPLLTVAAAGMAALVAVVASAAFAIASRRQLRTVGLLATAGADPATVRASLVIQGAVPGLLAGVLAVAAGALTAAVLQRGTTLERLTHLAGADLALSWWGAVVAVTIGTGAGALAAWHPSRVAARIPVLSALSGRRPVGPVDRRVPLTGLALWSAGAVAVVVGMRVGRTAGAGEVLGPFAVLGGVVALALGGVGLAPLAIALVGRLAERTTGMTRLALRGLSRNRAQSASAVAAVAMALALPVGVLTVRAGSASDEPRPPATAPSSRDSQPTSDATAPAGTVIAVDGALRSTNATEATDELLEILGPDATAVPTLPIVDQTGGWKRVAIIDEDHAEVLAGWAAAAVRRGDAVALGRTPPGGPITLTVADDTATFAAATAPGGTVGQASLGDIDYLVGRTAMGPVGRERPPDAIDVLRRAPMTDGERAEVRAVARRLQPAGWSSTTPTLAEVQRALGEDVTVPEPAEVWIGIRVGDDEYAGSPSPMTPGGGLDREAKWLLALAVASGLLAVLVLTIALSLRSVDGAADRAAALAAGATPAQVVRQRSVEGGVLALVGAGLALPLGWLTVTAVRFGEVRHTYAGEPGNAVLDRLVLPGWQVVPILLAPAVVVAIGWWVAPTIANALRRTSADQLLPRW